MFFIWQGKFGTSKPDDTWGKGNFDEIPFNKGSLSYGSVLEDYNGEILFSIFRLFIVRFPNTLVEAFLDW